MIEHMVTIRQFIDAYKVRCTVTEVDDNPNMNDMPNGSRHYKVRLMVGNRSYTVPFSQGPAVKAEPTAADVLDCLASDVSGVEGESFEDWASSYGYDTDSRKAERTYQACVRELRNLRRLLGPDAYLELLHNVERL